MLGFVFILFHVAAASNTTCQDTSVALAVEQAEEVGYREATNTRLELLQKVHQLGKGSVERQMQAKSSKAEAVTNLFLQRSDDWPNPAYSEYTPNYSNTEFPEALLGQWYPSEIVPQAILGPLSWRMSARGTSAHAIGSFTARRDPDTGDVWATVYDGQVLHFREKRVQYCFKAIPDEDNLGESSTFDLHSTTNTSVDFCWREGFPGMPTHAKGCKGCECAHARIELMDNDRLNFTFMMSPPVLHAHFILLRSSNVPTMQQIEDKVNNPYKHCAIKDRCLSYQYCPEVEPAEREPTNLEPPRQASGCLTNLMQTGALRQGRGRDKLQEGRLPLSRYSSAGPKAYPLIGYEGETLCFILNGWNVWWDGSAPPANHEIQADAASARAGRDEVTDRFSFNSPDRTFIPAVKFYFHMPKGPCNPCNVSYTVSAELAENEYISVGFKGMSWESEAYNVSLTHPATQRPCYFGMCVDPVDSYYLSDRIALGYVTDSHGACFREMMAPDYVHIPAVDFTQTEHRKLFNTSVEKVDARTVMRFTVEQRWPEEKMSTFRGGFSIGHFRIMWAIGEVSGGSDCNATVGFHGNQRGVAPISWLSTNGIECEWFDENNPN